VNLTITVEGIETKAVQTYLQSLTMKLMQFASSLFLMCGIFLGANLGANALKNTHFQKFHKNNNISSGRAAQTIAGPGGKLQTMEGGKLSRLAPPRQYFPLHSQNQPDDAIPVQENPDKSQPKSLLQKLKTLVLGDAKMGKAKLRSLGAAALLSYGWVSNTSYMICLSLAWYVHARRSGLSPLAPGQWPQFLAVYGGFFVVQNVIRPLRFAFSVFMTPVFDRMVAFIMKRTGLSKPKAFGVTVFLVNICGTFTLLFTGVTLASLAAGVPIFPSKSASLTAGLVL